MTKISTSEQLTMCYRNISTQDFQLFGLAYIAFVNLNSINTYNILAITEPQTKQFTKKSKR